MIINWYKYIYDNLPPRLRDIRLVQLLKVLLWEIPSAVNNFDLFLARANYLVNVNASKIALEKHIYHELDAIAEIETLDIEPGQAFDFLVNVYGIVDENRLKDLIERYKLAGKMYTFKLVAVVYTSKFKTYECESIDEQFTSTFKNYECVTNDHVYLWFSHLTILTSTSVRITLESTEFPTTTLTITGNLMGRDNLGNVYLLKEGFSLTLLSGYDISTTDETTSSVTGLTLYVDLASVVITPGSDANHTYLLVPEE